MLSKQAPGPTPRDSECVAALLLGAAGAGASVTVGRGTTQTALESISRREAPTQRGPALHQTKSLAGKLGIYVMS